MANRQIMLFSDVHANLEALVAVLGDAFLENSEVTHKQLSKRLYWGASRAYQKVINLGDVVGYGDNPNEVIELLARIPNLISVSGNHDEAMIEMYRGKDPDTVLEDYNEHTKQSLLWTYKQLSRHSLRWLVDNLVKKKRFVREYHDKDFLACHSGPGRFFDKYIVMHNRKKELVDETKNPRFYDPWDALEVIQESNLFVGHTHFVGIYRDPSEKIVRNIGSVGMPRDLKQGPTYITYDRKTDTSHLRDVYA